MMVLERSNFSLINTLPIINHLIIFSPISRDGDEGGSLKTKKRDCEKGKFKKHVERVKPEEVS